MALLTDTSLHSSLQFLLLVYSARTWFIAVVYLLSAYCECNDGYFINACYEKEDFH